MLAIATLFPLLLLAASPSPAPVPGQCTAPASENVDQPGCFLSAELALSAAGPTTFWHLHTFPTQAAAEAEARRHVNAAVVTAHGRVWLHVFGPSDTEVRGGERQTVVGPLAVPDGGQVRLLESWFPPGMKTRVHSHSGPEAFYVLEGQQCVETPAGGHLINTGEHYVVTDGPHLQAAPQGRRNVVVVMVEKGAPWISLESDWQPSGFCDRGAP